MGLLDAFNAQPGSAEALQLQGLLGGLTRMGGLLAQAGQFRPAGTPGPGIGDAFLGFGEGQKQAIQNGMQTRQLQRSISQEDAWRDAASGAPKTPEGQRLYGSIPERHRTSIFAMGPEQGLKALSGIITQRPVAVSPGQTLVGNDGPGTRVPYTEQDFEYKRAGAPRTSVTNVNNIPEGVPHVGPIPPEMQLTRLPNNGGWAMQPIAGSDADVKRAKEAEAKRVEAANKGRAGDVVVQDLDRALALHAKRGMLPTAGLGAATAAKIPGTAASDVNQLLDSAKSGISFNALTEMRKASPTGAALGSVQVRELEMLQAALGSLNQSQSPAQFQQNLTRARNLFLDIVHGQGGGPPRIPDGISAAGPGGRPPPAQSGGGGATMRWNPQTQRVEPVR